ncbi:hypothetical protein V6N12_018955 [Hibiscus sabdariffa]|uniref:SURF1-like protein n=1 Tax=Hibiscus sabdariffa TaxID=183260 RepID=A0ABR2AZ59_9ROSI
MGMAMASNLRAKTAIISKALTRPRPTGPFYATSHQSLPQKHWVPLLPSTSPPLLLLLPLLHPNLIMVFSLIRKEKDQNGQDGSFSFLELSLSALEPGRFSEGKTRQKRLEMEPLKLNNMPPLSEISETLEFRRAVCKGVFDNGRSIYIGPRSRSISGVTENGYYVITPLMPIPGDVESVQSPVLVNRGWVPRSWRDKSFEVPQDGEKFSSMDGVPAQQNEQSWWRMFRSKKNKAVEDQTPAITSVEVTGVVRGSEKPIIFVPANDPNSGQWFYVDVPAIAVACGLPKETLLIEDINENVDPSNPYPVPKDVNALIHSSVMPQDHLNYTLTWYSLSAAVTFMAFKRLKPKSLHWGPWTSEQGIESLRDIADCETAGDVEKVARNAIPIAPPDFLSVERNS